MTNIHIPIPQVVDGFEDIMVVADVGRYDDDNDDGDSQSTKNADDNSLYDVNHLYQNAVECIVNSKSVISKLQAQLSMKDTQILTKDAQIMQLEEELIRTKLDLAMTKAMHDHDRFMLQTTVRMNRGEDNEEPCRPPSVITAYTPSTILAPTSNRRKSTSGVRDDINRNSDMSSGSKSGFVPWPELPPDDAMKPSAYDNVQSAPKSFARSAYDYQQDDYEEANDAKQLNSYTRSSSDSSRGLLRKCKSMINFTFQQDDYEDNNTARLTSWVTRSTSNSSFGSMINSDWGERISSRRSTVDAGGLPGGMRTSSYPQRITYPTYPTAPCILEGSGVVVFPESHDDCDQHLWAE